jgi:hypothetical protein
LFHLIIKKSLTVKIPVIFKILKNMFRIFLSLLKKNESIWYINLKTKNTFLIKIDCKEFLDSFLTNKKSSLSLIKNQQIFC